ncbi:hypothetical protein K493DRAFT_208473 [Basidiobolus meristosporus CBS 931.73]|uniref:peptidylprolyl isomerase n=1 Tax=Basidiobolus meristosporus CBS 931.73 TaxID=1314790 RepID=A0A1Y1YXM0_9FUNG|nr:hypothetical protein K493DRAFT_208473 [Basidiobolus meristosporus CBS 931.73]|eukprot:ORY02315.1 hypothetical protein K493DRAFT_208473 [Basidiobolus meristosporus CBS 931.73]
MGNTREVIQFGDGKNFPKRVGYSCLCPSHCLTNPSRAGTAAQPFYNRGEPFRCKIGVGNAWEEGILQMSVGEVARFWVTGDHVWDERGRSGVIPPNATIMFIIALLGTGEAPESIPLRAERSLERTGAEMNVSIATKHELQPVETQPETLTSLKRGISGSLRKQEHLKTQDKYAKELCAEDKAYGEIQCKESLSNVAKALKAKKEKHHK